MEIFLRLCGALAVAFLLLLVSGYIFLFGMTDLFDTILRWF